MKNKNIHVRVSEADYKMIRKRSKELNMTISDYLRRLAIVDVAKS